VVTVGPKLHFLQVDKVEQLSPVGVEQLSPVEAELSFQVLVEHLSAVGVELSFQVLVEHLHGLINQHLHKVGLYLPNEQLLNGIKLLAVEKQPLEGHSPVMVLQ
jgi:hypothetical protein